MDRQNLTEIRRLLETFITGDDRTIRVANEIEGALDSAFPEDERFEELVHALASYRPGGGDFLYDAEAILPLVRSALVDLENVVAFESSST